MIKLSRQLFDFVVYMRLIVFKGLDINENGMQRGIII